MNKEKTFPLKAVYCYYFPEVRKIIDQVSSNYPHEVFLQSVSPGLDHFHERAIESYLRHFQSELPDLGAFPFRYTSGGASESIFHLLSYIKTYKAKVPLYVLQGEYEGYASYGSNLGLKFSVIKSLNKLISLPKGILFLSNPSARDGNIISNQEIIRLADYGHQIVYDATYVGLTDPYCFELNHPNIIAVIVSLSKPFGLYYYRIGFAFTRFEISTLETNKWFKNIHSLIIAEKVLNQIDSKKLVKHYRSVQKDAISLMNRDLGTKANPSHVVLLAHSITPPKDTRLLSFNRQSNYRYCLTPYYLIQERGFV